MNKIYLCLILVFTAGMFAFSESNVAVKVFSSSIEASFEAGSDAYMVFDFDEETVNSRSGWIEIYFDQKIMRMCAGTSLEAPFDFEIPGRALKAGKHMVEFMILSNAESEREIILQADVLMHVSE